MKFWKLVPQQSDSVHDDPWSSGECRIRELPQRQSGGHHMIRIGGVSIALLGWIVFSVAFAMLLPSAAQAACSKWNVSGVAWTVSQTNGISAHFTLQQTGTDLQGSAQWFYQKEDGGIGVNTSHLASVNGSVDGTINGDFFEVTVYWDNDTTGVYTGKIGPQGRMTGTTADKMNPHSVASFHNDQTFKCLASAGGVSPSSITPPVGGGSPASAEPYRALGKVQLPPTTLGPPRPICDVAAEARARNSPAAPGLEAQCRAAASAEPAKALGKVQLPPTTTAAAPPSICDSARAARARNSPAAPGLEAQCRAAGGK
jgi:hypothetical protein